MSPHRPSTRQTGAASLIVVMLLFFIVSLVAAYTSRNLIFEQKTSANQYRSTQAFEAAEAGVEWTLAMLNAGRVDDDCKPTTDPTFNTFRDRYLSAAGADNTAVGSDGAITLRTRSNGEPLMPSCVFDPEAGPMEWACRCPSDAAASLPAVAGTAAHPMFRIRFQFDPDSTRRDVVNLVSAGCTRPDAACLAADPSAPPGDAASVLTVTIALKSALTTPPGAAVTARLNIDTGTGPLRAANTDPFTQGVTLLAGGTINGSRSGLTSTPGTPGTESALPSDSALAGLALFAGISIADRMFASVFGMRPDMYRQQPAAVNVDCSAGCTSSAINTLVANNPGRVLWLDGGLAGGLTVDGDIGTAAGPALLVVTGNLSLASGVYTGVLYSRQAIWDRGAGAAEVRGALIAEGSLLGNGGQSIVYDAAVVNRLRTGHGSFVRVPGGWRDF